MGLLFSLLPHQVLCHPRLICRKCQTFSGKAAAVQLKEPIFSVSIFPLIFRWDPNVTSVSNVLYV